jgi:type IV pilus assembly protein PilV
MTLKTPKFFSGFTIMEMLVAMLILTTGLIGVAGLQLRAQQFNYTAYFRSQATFLVNDLMERIRINTDTTTTNNNGDNGAYQFPSNGQFTDIGPGGVTTVDKTCDVRPAETSKPDCYLDNSNNKMVNYDLNNWFNQVRETLPTGKARIVWNAASRIYTITIQWKRMPNTISYDGELTWTLQL